MIDQRHKNYVEYYEKVDPIKQYSLEELMDMNEMELLAIMPNNQCVDEYSECMGFYVKKNICTFKMHKVIDGSWHIGYYENHRDKAAKDQYVLFEITYVRDLKLGLIDLLLKVQNRWQGTLNAIKNGWIRISLGESWDDRAALDLPPLEKPNETEEVKND